MTDSVTYKGSTLASNSNAYKLFKEGKVKELDKHMKELEVQDRQRTGDPTQAIERCRLKISQNTNGRYGASEFPIS